MGFRLQSASRLLTQELETAARYDITVIAVIFNNSLYGSIRMHSGDALSGKSVGTELSLGDFAKMGESLGVHAVRVQYK
ncbi:thiamine pyrophosphate-dependent enzyme [Siminovitchia terrae]|uniref:thiamine pyrophosphate-dependent enzyme n=1 Tax=Siminovitchia terrae TaxID=1914933 RepID=UPI00163BF0EB|nr:thiamine pyrophosphate-dependent enzyme [Siminovitchia terrae]GIN92885.1 hypothetical protein J22TS1_39360 [Siminovitchia terrae]